MKANLMGFDRGGFYTSCTNDKNVLRTVTGTIEAFKRSKWAVMKAELYVFFSLLRIE